MDHLYQCYIMLVCLVCFLGNSFLSFQIFFFDLNLCWGLCCDWIFLPFSSLIYCMNVLSCLFFKSLEFHLDKSFLFFWNLWLGRLFSFRPSLFFFFLFFWNLWQGRLFFFFWQLWLGRLFDFRSIGLLLFFFIPLSLIASEFFFFDMTVLEKAAYIPLLKEGSGHP